MNNKIISIALFGASGQTGKAIATEGFLHNIKIKTINKRSPSLNDLIKMVRNVNAVVIVFGPRPPYTDVFCAEETKKIIQAMQKVRVKRLICQTGAMIGNYSDNRSLLFNLMCYMYKRNNPRGYKDRVQQENEVKNSSLAWTIIKPPRLTNNNEKEIQTGENVKVGLLTSISRKNLAQFIIKELFKPHFVRKAIFMKNYS